MLNLSIHIYLNYYIYRYSYSVCGTLICTDCSTEDLLLYVPDEATDKHDVKWSIINDFGVHHVLIFNILKNSMYPKIILSLNVSALYLSPRLAHISEFVVNAKVRFQECCAIKPKMTSGKSNLG